MLETLEIALDVVQIVLIAVVVALLYKKVKEEDSDEQFIIAVLSAIRATGKEMIRLNELTVIPESLKVSLASARINAELTQEDVAKKMHVSKRTIVNWEKGISSPSVLQADALYNMYNRPKDSIRF